MKHEDFIDYVKLIEMISYCTSELYVELGKGSKPSCISSINVDRSVRVEQTNHSDISQPHIPPLPPLHPPRSLRTAQSLSQANEAEMRKYTAESLLPISESEKKKRGKKGKKPRLAALRKEKCLALPCCAVLCPVLPCPLCRALSCPAPSCPLLSCPLSEQQYTYRVLRKMDGKRGSGIASSDMYVHRLTPLVKIVIHIQSNFRV